MLLKLNVKKCLDSVKLCEINLTWTFLGHRLHLQVNHSNDIELILDETMSLDRLLNVRNELKRTLGEAEVPPGARRRM